MAVLFQQQNVTRVKLGPGTYFSYQKCSVHSRTYPYAYSQNLEKKIYSFFEFPENIFILKSG